jgi:hypothetical protein
MEWVVARDVSDSGQAVGGADPRAKRRIAGDPGAPIHAEGSRSAADDETRAHRLPPPGRGAIRVDETAAWPAAMHPTERLHAPPQRDERVHRTATTAAPERRNVLRMALIGVVALCAVGAAVFVGLRSYEPEVDETDGVATDTWHPKYAPQKDVALEDCKIDRDGAHVGGTVRNPTDAAADYVIEVHLVDASGATITSASPTALAVPAETKTTWTGVLPPVASTAQSATCKLVKVDRYASPMRPR